MTDSESDTSNNVFTFQNVNTTVNAKGPHTNITNLSFRNQLTSTMYMPRNFERQRYAESAYDQRSMYYRRETSPMSIHSACDIRQQHFQQYYPGVSSQRPMFNGRSGSPMSMRSIDSNASVSAADIASAFKNVKYNKNELKMIKDAYHKLMYGSMKQRVRKRIEKRRKLFLKGSRRRSGDDSGEQGSNSSISSDDCRSIKTSYKENMSSSRSARIDLSNFRKTVRDSNLLTDCSDNFKQNTFKNKFPVGSGSVNNTQNFNNTTISKQSHPMPSQKDIFRNGFLLPSQRFNRSVASSEIPEISEKTHKNIENNEINNVKNHYSQNKLNKNSNCPRESEEEEIFSEMTVREKCNFNIKSQRKRNFDSEEVSSLPERKKSRVVSPEKIAHKNKRAPTKLKNDNPSNNTIEMSNNFEFVKPTLPIRKSKPQEKLIVKCSQPLTGFVEPVSNKVKESKQILQPSNLQEKATENQTQHDQSEITQYNDVSMRPSFIKRKLFTQKLDVAEKANLSSDSTNSPQSNVYSLQKEKNKARKLVTNQSCLNREVQDDSNLLELIQKIVPLDSMNITNQTTMNQTKADINNRNKDNEDKWDITSVISMCNDDDVSDTYTDEEIFEGDNNKKDTKKNKDINSKADKKTDKVLSSNIRDCKIMVEKIHNSTIHKQVNNQSFNLTHNNVTKSNIKSSAKSFWDTDFESDAECQTVLPRSYVLDNLKRANIALEATKKDLKNPTGYARNQFAKKSQQILEVSKQLNNTMNNTVLNGTIDSMRKFNTSTLSIRSHRTSKKKKCCNETCTQEIKSKPDNLNQIPVDIKKHNGSHPNQKITENNNLKTDVQIKNSTHMPKSKLNTQNEKLANTARSTSQSKKSPKEKKPQKAKAVENPIKNTKKSESKSKPENSSDVTNNRVKSKLNTHDSSAVKNKVEKKSEVTQVKTIVKPNTKNENQNNKKVTQNRSLTNKPKSRTDRQNSSIRSKKNNQVSQPTNSNLDNTVESIQKTTIRSDRPVRSCRNPSQSSFIELSKSSLLNNTSDGNRSLRSRVINLSSSIENITIKIKPRKKITINNKNISQINTRKSDVSFSLGADKQTPTPKKFLARSRGDFFKGKRKT